jgi:hypothetical protein
VLHALRRRVGHRGACLLFFALLDLIYGSLLIGDEPTPGTTLAYLGEHWPPLHVWGWVWIAVGLLCATQAFMRQDAAAFVAAMFIKVAWGAAHFWAFVEGAPRALAGVVIWTFAMGLVYIISTWPEPTYEAGDG